MTRQTCLLWSIIAFAAPTRAADLCEFTTATDAADSGWYAKAADNKPQPALAIATEAKVGKTALEARGVEGQGPYGGLRLVRKMDLSACNVQDKLVLWVKQNASRGIYVNFAFADPGNAYRAVKVERGKWTRIELDLDIKNWDGHRAEWGVATQVSFYTRAFDAPGEFLRLDGLEFEFAGENKPIVDLPFAGPKLDGWTFPQATPTHWILGNDRVAFAISKVTGAVAGGWNVATRERYLDKLEAVYFVESKTFEKQFDAATDRVERVETVTPTEVRLRCRNAALPELRIVKEYSVGPDANKLVRKLTLVNEGSGMDWYATPSSRLSMRRTFRDAGYYMGAGYVGPLVPAPPLTAPIRVSRYRSSSKGMLLVNRPAGYTLAHYRFSVNGHFLFPWQSKYVEAHNCLYYTPTGWQMALVTVALRPKQPAAIQEHVMILPGSQHEFLAGEYPKLPEVAARLHMLEPRPTWREDIKLYIGAGIDEHIVPTVQQVVELTDGGNILVLFCPYGPWTDYPSRRAVRGAFGGKLTGEWIKQTVAKLHALSPRVKVCIYTWLMSGSWAARPVIEHPDWFRPRNKAGNMVNCFPGCAANFATLINKPACRKFLLDQYRDHFRDWGVDAIYLDGAKTSNLIDWEQNTLTQDADWEDFWLDMRKVCRAAGPDKTLFFNGRANLYADISFIEARSEMREANWRDYAGLMVATKSFVSNDPGFVIIPLYWMSSLAAAYVNHFIPLGYCPAIGHGSTGAIRRLPFITAGYELKRVQIADAGIEPDWQADPLTQLESYAMRQGRAVVLGLIGHFPVARTEAVSVDAAKCGFDAKLPVFAWEFDLADPTTFRGRASEAEVKRVYRDTGWSLDRTTTVRLHAAQVVDGRVALRLEFDGHMLKLVALSQAPAAVWSVDGMPAHFNLASVRGVTITRKGPLEVQVNCQRDECEALLRVAGPGGAQWVTVDGQEQAHSMQPLAGAWFAKVRLGRGAHAVRWRSKPGSGRTERIGLVCPERIEPGQAMTVQVSAPRPVVLAGMLDGRPVMCQVLEPGKCKIPVPAALAKGALELTAYADGGQAKATVQVADKKYKPALEAVFPKAQPPRREVRDVGKTVRGVKVLRAATMTHHSSLGSAHVAKLDVDALRFEVGTADWFTSFMGQAYAGIEAEGLRAVTLRVQNTFYRAFSLRATRYHLHPYKRSSRPFAGIMVDYHTPKGYAKRVALSVGLLDLKRSSIQPDWGCARKPDQFIELAPLIDRGNDATLTVDLSRYAPADWDGRVWFTASVDWVAPNRRITVTILDNEPQPSGKVTVGTDLADLRASFKKPRRVEVPKATFVPEIDGVMDEEAWQEAALIDNFVLLDEKGLPKVWTRARLFYDDTRLYIGIKCQEPDRTAPLVGSENIWRDDEVELWFDVDGDPATTHQLIVNANGDSLGLLPVGRWKHNAQCAAKATKGRWTVEVAVPFKSLGATPKVGDAWKFNIARHRPGSINSNNELITWSVLHASFRSAKEFGTLVFRGVVAK